MKTILLSLCWLGEPSRLERNLEWLRYYRSIKDKIGFDEIILLDNASDIEELKKLKGTILNSKDESVIHWEAGSDLTIYRFDDHLARISAWDMPYHWRGFEYTKRLLPLADKFLFIDSDCYVLTSRFAEKIKSLSSGWISPWCKMYKFPETGLQILNKDSFNLFDKFPIPGYSHYITQSAETFYTFTGVIDATGDRHGEKGLPQTTDMDYYMQWHPSLPKMIFDLQEHNINTKDGEEK